MALPVSDDAEIPKDWVRVSAKERRGEAEDGGLLVDTEGGTTFKRSFSAFNRSTSSLWEKPIQGKVSQNIATYK